MSDESRIARAFRPSAHNHGRANGRTMQPQLLSREQENTSAPRYIATSGLNGEYVESADSLSELLAILRELVSPDVAEDVAVWREDALAAVVLADGTTHTFERRSTR